MFFNSFEFLAFFAVVFSAFWLLRGETVRLWLLLVASYFFYVCFNGQLAVVVALSSIADYFIALALENPDAGPARRKGLITLSIVMNLGLLVYFKYANFFIESLQDLLAHMGVQRHLPLLEVILPIGISFYTFEAISYTVDVYTRRARAERNPLRFMLFIAFFPRMVAGPIIRAKNFMPQLRRSRRFDWARIKLGLEYIVMGLFKKIAIADRMASLVDPVYDNPAHYNTSAIWIAVIAYSMQIYGDFSGYSDIAIGLAHLLGFKLPENFNMPYIARNISDFWRRWHISLSTWLRDYVFIQMGGSRGSIARTAFTLMTTFALCGLWHGAKWTFVAFGVAHGAMMVVHRLFQEVCKRAPALKKFAESAPGTFLCIVFTFFCVTMGWVFFRAQDFHVMREIFHGLFVGRHGGMVKIPVGPWSLVFTVTVVWGAHLLGQGDGWKRALARLSPAAWGIGCTAVLTLMFLLRTGVEKVFIYFQF